MSYCIVIPNYNHTVCIAQLLRSLMKYQLPVIMVNDASCPEATAIFTQLAAEHDFLELINHPLNMGKGGAVQTGLKAAAQRGFTHALQIDADGQHDLADVETLLAHSKRHPQALISGMPIYDSSIPKLRYYARNITHFWVWIETLSLSIKDTMCGYRVYPLAQTMQLFSVHKLGMRMDFDIEVMVKLYWQEVDIHFIPTAVHYPEFGISHFRAFEDNVLISWMHTKLVLGMLYRLPKLLSRKFR